MVVTSKRIDESGRGSLRGRATLYSLFLIHGARLAGGLKVVPVRFGQALDTRANRVYDFQ